MNGNSDTTTLLTAGDVEQAMTAMASAEKARHLMRFFKTAPGQYGHGDKFLGIAVPETRAVVSRCGKLSLNDIATLLNSEWHEVRLCAVLCLVDRFERLCTKRMLNDIQARDKRDELVDFYLHHTQGINNWDLVDMSVYKILGQWLLTPSRFSDLEKQAMIDRLASSTCLWQQRMAVVCTFAPLKAGVAHYTLRYATWHLRHPHDLMHKAVGWMLREMGKKVSMDLLRQFLDEHHAEMSRTTLRYAIEKMSNDERKQWLAK